MCEFKSVFSYTVLSLKYTQTHLQGKRQSQRTRGVQYTLVICYCIYYTNTSTHMLLCEAEQLEAVF